MFELLLNWAYSSKHVFPGGNCMKLPPATRQSYYVLHAQFQVGNGYSPFAVMLQKSRCIVIPLPLMQSFHVLSVAGREGSKGSVDCWRKKPEKDEQAWGRRRGKGKLGLFILPLLSKMQYPSSNRVQGLIVILKLKETVSVSCTRQYFVSGSESHSKIIHIIWYVLYKDEGRPIAWLDEEGPRRRQTDRRLYCVWNGLAGHLNHFHDC